MAWIKYLVGLLIATYGPTADFLRMSSSFSVTSVLLDAGLPTKWSLLLMLLFYLGVAIAVMKVMDLILGR